MSTPLMSSFSRGGVCAAVVFACVLAHPMLARAQSAVTVTANPTSVAPGATVTLNATITPAGYDCGYGCAVIGMQGYLQISGSNGYYTSTTDGNGGWFELPGSDPGPGQTLQPVTYTASGGFHYDLCYYEPGWEFYGCVWGYGSYDESGSNYVSVGPAVAPSAISVSPSSGAGPRQTFVFQYSSPAGEGDIAQTWQILHQYGQTSQSCVVGFYRPGTFVLWDDAGPGNDQYAAPNTPVVLENSQCRLHMANTTIAGVGNNLTVVIDVSFKSGYFGDKAVVAYGYSNGGGYGTPLVTYWTARPQLNTPPNPVLPSQTMTLNGMEFGTSGTVKFNACDGTGIAGTVSSWGSTSIAVRGIL